MSKALKVGFVIYVWMALQLLLVLVIKYVQTDV